MHLNPIQEKAAIASPRCGRERFLETASTNRELLVSLIERAELTSGKQIIIKFRFKQLEDS